MKVAISFSMKDRVELSEKTLLPLLQPELFDLFLLDGSSTSEGRDFALSNSHAGNLCMDVRGGADAAIVYALTTMLQSRNGYTHVGLVENDVLLPSDWFERTMALFELGAADGLAVGAVSPRCYVDRVLIQRDGYAVMHNLGAGVVIFTREAARLVLQHTRTGHTLENRRTFAHLTGFDIGPFWAFGAGEHNLCNDWQFDKVLASCGLASLALTPSPVEMIGQTPPLADQGLVIADGPVEARRNDAAFEIFQLRTQRIREVEWRACNGGFYSPAFAPEANGVQTIFPHQIGAIGGWYTGDWKLHWHQGLGPFAWKAGFVDGHEAYSGADGAMPRMEARVSGPCQVLVSGGLEGGEVLVEDTYSGYSNDPLLAPQKDQGIIAITVPAGVSYRKIRLIAKTPGVIFYGLKVMEFQPYEADWNFDHSVLPPVE